MTLNDPTGPPQITGDVPSVSAHARANRVWLACLFGACCWAAGVAVIWTSAAKPAVISLVSWALFGYSSIVRGWAELQLRASHDKARKLWRAAKGVTTTAVGFLLAGLVADLILPKEGSAWLINLSLGLSIAMTGSISYFLNVGNPDRVEVSRRTGR